jgi:hypothetical protein
MSLCKYSVAPGEKITTNDIGKPVWCVAIYEFFFDADSQSVSRFPMIGLSQGPKPLSIINGFPLAKPLGNVTSIDLDGIWVTSVDEGG